MTDSDKEKLLKKQQVARARLVASAALARKNGRLLEWKDSPNVLNFCKESGLSEDILEHIVHWVMPRD